MNTNTTAVPHEIRSLLPLNNNIRATSPSHIVIFPPEIPQEYRTHSRSKTSTPQPQHGINVKTNSLNTISSGVHQVEGLLSQSNVKCFEVYEPSYIQQVEKHNDSKSKASNTILNPITESILKPKIPMTNSEVDISESHKVATVELAIERSSPTSTAVDTPQLNSKLTEDIFKKEHPISEHSESSYKLTGSKITTRPVGNNPVRYIHGYNKSTPTAPLFMTTSSMYSSSSAVASKSTFESTQISSSELKSSSFNSVESTIQSPKDFIQSESNFEHTEKVVFDEPKNEKTQSINEEFTAMTHTKSKNIDNNVQKSNSYNDPVSSENTPIAIIQKPSNVPQSVNKSLPIAPLPSQTNDTFVEPVAPMPKSSIPAALLAKKLTCLIKKQNPKYIPTPIPIPNIGGQPVGRNGASAGLTAPRRGRGVLNPQNLTPGARVPLCGQCNLYIRGPFITALGKIWCPEHFVCTNEKCKRPLQDIGFVEEDNGLYCEYCFEQYLAPVCNKCSKKIKGDCLNAIGKQFHPECFNCTYCNKLFGNSPFFLEDSLPYCEEDWNELFTTKCIACGFPIEAGDRWVEALNNNYHSPCFNCSKCKVNLEGQSFFAKGGRPFCKSHAR